MTTPASTSPIPLRRHDHGLRYPARAGVVVIGASSIATARGSTRARTLATSAAEPTGRSAERTRCSLPSEEENATFARSSHQPNGRHRIGCRASSAWMRPGAIVSFTVERRPDPTRIPCGVDAIE